MTRRKPFSEKALRAAIEEVAEKGVAVTIKTAKVVCTITPPERTAPVNPADLIDP